MKLYHGTNCRNIKKFEIIKRNLKDNTRGAPDLGPGIYFTSSKDQAIEFSCMHSNIGAIYEIEIDLDLLNGIVKPIPDDDYYLLCYLSRINLSNVANETINNYKKCDYIFGKVIKDTKNFDVIANKFNDQDDEEMFNETNWKTLFNEFKRNVKFHKNMNQYCFKSEKARDLINSNITTIYYTKNGKIIK